MLLKEENGDDVKQVAWREIQHEAGGPRWLHNNQQPITLFFFNLFIRIVMLT